MCETNPIENVWTFKYLGTTFRADGDQYTNVRLVKIKIARTMSTVGKMRNVRSSKVPVKLKMRLYKSGVCSQPVYSLQLRSLDT